MHSPDLLEYRSAGVEPELPVEREGLLVPVGDRDPVYGRTVRVKPRKCPADECRADTLRAVCLVDIDGLDLARRLRRERTDAVAHALLRRRIEGEIDPQGPDRRHPGEVRLPVVEGYPLVQVPERPGMGTVVGVQSGPERADNLDAGDVRGAVLDVRRRCDHAFSLPTFAGHPGAAASSIPRYCVPQAQSASMIGRRVLPNSVTAYSTRGGTSG